MSRRDLNLLGTATSYLVVIINTILMKFTSFENTLLFAVALFASDVEAFWGKGHLLVARRAEAILAETDSTDNVLTQALAELS